MLSIFVGSWMIGTVSVGYSATREQTRDLHRETKSAALRIAKELEAAQNLLSFKAKSIADIASLSQIVSTQDEQALLKTLLPLKSSLDLDLIKVVTPQGTVLSDVRSTAVGNVNLQDSELIEIANRGLWVNSIVLSDGNEAPLLVRTLGIKSRQSEVGTLIVGYALTPEVLGEIIGAERQQIVLLQQSDTAPLDTAPLDTKSKIIATTLPAINSSEGLAVSAANQLNAQGINARRTPIRVQSVQAQSVQIENIEYLRQTISLPQIADDRFKAVVLTPLTTFKASQRRMWLLVGGLGLVSGLAVSLVGLFVTRLIVRRIAKLTDATQTLASGDLSFRIPVEGKDEVATLASGFNHMAEQLKQRDLKIQAQLEELEQLVDELQKMPERVHTERMAGLGQMVAGIAHEINNPISFIYGNVPAAKHYIEDLLNLLNLYQQHLPEPPDEIRAEEAYLDVEFITEDLCKLLDSMSTGAERISEIVLSLRNFSRKDEATMKPVDIHEGIESTLVILENRLKTASPSLPIQIVKEYGELPTVDCFASEINQVFMNVLSNAIDAIEGTAQTNAKQVDQCQRCPQIRIKTEVDGDRYITLTISDNGPGISEAVRAQLFTPFFTTKAVGRGTGLGLSISYQIVVEKHGGKISCQSAVGKGTQFIIQLPIVQLAAKAA